MTQPQDAQLLAALEQQLRELTTVLHRLEAAQRDLVPGPATFWRGMARHSYDRAIDALTTTAELSVLAARDARDYTSAAVSAVMHRG